MYITLEPCSHFSLNLPRTKVIVKAKINKIYLYLAIKDPNPLIHGKEIDILKQSWNRGRFRFMRNRSQET